ncbi:PAS domain-containing protein [Archangium violaceum]|uniref:sensor histidine kinase n=1 Tax=Archangium violaceum TaxID=83451 RepID=UPI00194FA3C0|nr:GAF domain-containing sensor histidine kinase [Archangium violaceum]QRN99656.1 PAS domain-containing protein [Archangium violaceum]
MPRVADFIEKNREQLIERFLREASKLESARGLKPYEVLDTLPEYLSTLTALSRQGHRLEPEKTKKRLEETHISLRLRHGYNQEEVTGEYVLIGRLIASLWENLPREEQPSTEDTALLFAELQDAMNQVVATFSGDTLEDRQREKRTLRRLDALASELMGDVENPQPLHERLGALVEVVRQALHAKGAALLLTDPSGKKLLPATSTGAWSTGADTGPVPVDSASFVARVAASDEPVELADAASANLEVAEAVRHSGVHSLLGLRLWPHGKLLGVLYIGIAELRPFAPQARRYLETLVEYLSGIIEKTLLLQRFRQANEQLRQSETRYRLATEAISDAVWEWNLLTNELSWNQGVEKLFGHPREQLGGHISGWYDHIHPEERDRVVHGIHAAIDGEAERWRDEYRFRHRDGHYVNVTDHGLIERDAGGRAVRMVGVMQDITESKAASEALRSSEDRLRLALRAAELGTWDMDPVTGVLRWDERCKALFGLPPEADVTYDSFLSGIHPEDRAHTAAVVQRALSGENGGEYDTEFRSAVPHNGVERWVRATGRAFFEGGRAVRFIGTVHDVSDKKRQEAERRTRAEFEEQLIGIVSHDLRNPLNAINLSVAALLRNEDLSERQAKGIARIAAAAERATRLIRDLLDFTRARLGGGIPIERRPFDLHHLTRQTVDEVRFAHPEREVEVVQSGQGRGEWDGDRLAQVVTNLLNNALTYSPPETLVRVETRGEDDTFLLRVHNEGKPIPPELLPRLFNPMMRGTKKGDTSSRNIGLGLYIVNNIVHAHGGMVEVCSTEAEGTTFTVRLPRGAASAAKSRSTG